MSGPPKRWTWRQSAVAALLVAGCSAPSSPPGTAPPDFKAAICAAQTSYAAGNHDDYKTFIDYVQDFMATTNTKSQRVDALAAIARMDDRTGKVTDDFEAAGRLWEPGARAAEGMAAYYRDLMPILAEFKASAEKGVVAESWKTQIEQYNAWYYDSAPEYDAADAELDRFGVTCR